MLRFALELSHHGWLRRDARDAREWLLELVRAADSAGFDTLWLTEDPGGWDAYAVLASLTTETQRISLGPGVVNPLARPPQSIAASVMTLDRLAGGRSFLGIGRGQPEWHPDAASALRSDPLGAVAQTIEIVRRNPTATACVPPVYLAAAGPRALDLAGQVADGVRFNELATAHFLRGAIGRVRAAAVAAGREPDALRFFAHPGLTITDQPEEVLEGKKRWIALVHALPGMDVHLETPGIDHAGVMATVRRAMRTDEILRAGGGFDALRRHGNVNAAIAAIPTELVDAAAIVGSIDHVKARLKELASFGVTDCFLDLDRIRERGADLDALLQELGGECA